MAECRLNRGTPERIRKALESRKADIPALGDVLDAFGPLILVRAEIRDGLPEADVPAFRIDPATFSQGVPLVTGEVPAPDDRDLVSAAARLVPIMADAFPGIGEDLRRIEAAARDADPTRGEFLAAIKSGTDEALDGLAVKLSVNPDVLKFSRFQILKPFAERFAESLPPFPEDLTWTRGYCPVCGSWPEVGFIEGQEGRRLLRCSFCAHEWRFMRTQCPFCEIADSDKLEIHFPADRSSERVELCHACKRYLVSLDLRDRADEPVREVVAVGLVYLDILAQDKGFSPGTALGWNIAAGGS
jgi:FdhE protein